RLSFAGSRRPVRRVSLVRMSLLKDPDPAHKPAVDQHVVDLSAAGQQGLSILLNLKEVTRIPAARQSFHACLALSTKPDAADRIRDASENSRRMLPVDPRAKAACRPWWTYTHLRALGDRR